MVPFQTLTLGHISDLGIENISNEADLEAVRNHSYQGILRLIGDDTTWNYRRAARYNAPFLKSSSTPSSPVFMSTAESFASFKNFFSLTALTASPGNSLKNHSSDADMTATSSSNDAGGYWAPIVSTLALASEHGVAGAAAKYSLVTSASNYDPAGHGANDDPTWAIIPR